MKTFLVVLCLIATVIEAAHWENVDDANDENHSRAFNGKKTVVEESKKMLDEIQSKKLESNADLEGNQFKEEERSENKKEGESVVHADQEFKGMRVLGGRVSDTRATQRCKSLKDKGTKRYTKKVCLDEKREEYGAVLEGIDEDIRKNLDVKSLSPQKALNDLKKESVGKVETSNGETIVYVDQHGKKPKAKVGFIVTVFDNDGKNPRMPTRVVDAETGETVEEWDNLQTIGKVMFAGEGPGGNKKTGIYHFGSGMSKYKVTDLGNNKCAMEAEHVKTVDLGHAKNNYKSDSFQFNCYNQSSDAINGAGSPMNDAMYFGYHIYQMYQEWFGEPPIRTKTGEPFTLVLKTHYSENYENAFWNGRFMTFGDGANFVYPLVSLDVTAHEIAHGISSKTSGLKYRGDSGGLNEAFSDMAGKAAERFLRGKSGVKWGIGGEITKGEEPLRYMDRPENSYGPIADACKMEPSMDPHYSSGVFNRVFYLLATHIEYDVWDAFEIFYVANTRFWSEDTTFTEAAELTLKAAEELKEGRHTMWDMSHINIDTIRRAFAAVHISCVSAGTKKYKCYLAGCPKQSRL